MPDFALESRLLQETRSPGATVVGLDEVGRGPLAGPVVAAAFAVTARGLPPALSGLIDDSKALTPARREAALRALRGPGPWVIALGLATVREIDQMNVLAASLLAMRRAYNAVSRRLGASPVGALVDGDRLPDLPCPAQAIVKGDTRCQSIAAASIAAKVRRDALMARLARRHPGYGWERNAGYGTAEHRAALARLGVTPQHRRSFAPVAALIDQDADR